MPINKHIETYIRHAACASRKSIWPVANGGRRSFGQCDFHTFRPDWHTACAMRSQVLKEAQKERGCRQS